jgi:hypothetical protein
LEVLDSDQPNANHEAIAELARRGRCSAVVATNFDTLLERAFRRFRTSARVMRKRGCGDESETPAFMRMGTASPKGVLLGVDDLR